MTLRTHLLKVFAIALAFLTALLAGLCYSYGLHRVEHTLYTKLLIGFFFLGALAAIFVPLIYLYLYSNRLNHAFQRLKDLSLAIAAGEYKHSLRINGPQEIQELANAMQTMSECLQEHHERFKESSALRERMHGEYECAMMLQYYMLGREIENYKNAKLNIRHIEYRSTAFPHGCLVDFDGTSQGTTIAFAEAMEDGFASMYDLLVHKESSKRLVELQITDRYTKLKVKVSEMPLPIHWSARQEKLSILENQAEIAVEKEDLIFLYNHGLAKNFDNPQVAAKWFQKVLRHFASEGTELCFTMLNCEINFLTQKQHIDHDINILCIQIT